MSVVLFKFSGAPGHAKTQSSGNCFPLLPITSGAPEEGDSDIPITQG